MLKSRNKGITLVALVITIIILLILAGISISALTNTGLFARANEAKQKTAETKENQSKVLNEYEYELNKYLPREKFSGKTVAEAIKYGEALNTENNTELQDEIK